MSKLDQEHHIPVLGNEVIDSLSLQDNGFYIDGTVGFGGHANQILSSNASVNLLGIDRDAEAISYTENFLKKYKNRVTLIQGEFGAMNNYTNKLGWQYVNGILLDIGISSFQIDNAIRGFSFAENGPLDMRMNRNQRLTASELINTTTVKTLISIFRNYGEVSNAKKLAAAIVTERAKRPWERTLELANFIKKTNHEPLQKYSKTVAKCFQALRIAVNDELGQLKQGLHSAINLLTRGGRIIVISFHSLEDRIVKETFRYEALTCECPPKLPVCRCEKQSRLKVLTKRPVTSSAEEVTINNRSSSAKLRVAERI